MTTLSLSTPSVDWVLSGPRDIACPGRVPGDVLADLQSCAVLPDLWYGNYSLEAPWWVVREAWNYSTNFATPEASAGATLHFEGVDYNATFVLNGEELGSHVGSFLPAAFEVGALLRRDGARNRLVVTLHPPPAELIAPLYNASAAAPAQQYGIDHCLQARLIFLRAPSASHHSLPTSCAGAARAVLEVGAQRVGFCHQILAGGRLARRVAADAPPRGRTRADPDRSRQSA